MRRSSAHKTTLAVGAGAVAATVFAQLAASALQPDREPPLPTAAGAPTQLPRLVGDRTCSWGSAACNPPVRNIVAQFGTLRDHGDLLGFHMNGSPDVDAGRHWQGVQRLMSGQGRYVVVSRSGRGVSFVVVRMASRDRGGQRFRANRIGVRSSLVAPPMGDQVVSHKASDRGFDHSGGMQAVGRYLAVGLEESHRSRVVFWDLSRPEHPRRVGRLEHTTGVSGAGTVSMARLRGGRYVLIVGGTDANILDFYVSRTGRLDQPRFGHATRWRESQLKTTLRDGDREFGDYQNLNLVTDTSGRLYLIGTHRSGNLTLGADFADLFLLENLGNTVAITKVAKRHLYCGVPFAGQQCNFDAAGGVYVTPRRMLLLYGTEHANNGPQASVKAQEFRTVPHRAACDAIDQAWVELYDDSGFDGDRSIMIDYVDRDRRAYTNYDLVEGFEDKASAAWWCLPRGWRYRLYEHKSPCGGRVVDLVGSGTPDRDADFGDNREAVRDFGDAVSCSTWITP
jgi:hypothetical protein